MRFECCCKKTQMFNSFYRFGQILILWTQYIWNYLRVTGSNADQLRSNAVDLGINSTL
ncbi:MAG: hypothetical protein K0S24_3173 [Sphingobacterium sp.]|jgi:hypothetical protein|nr:hypothetical protein [Sphingobacterium sp.]